MPHLYIPSTTLAHYRHDPRMHLRRLPPAYKDDSTPHGQARDFSSLTRCDVELLPRKQKFAPCKVILVGDCAVGKTAIVNRFCYDKFQSNYKATIGVDFEIENFNILGQNFSLEMWDTAGQERFKCIAGAYYRNANVIVVTFDMSKRSTLESTKRWLSSALAHNPKDQSPLIFLVGTKSDLLTKEEFMRMETLASGVASEMKAEYWTVSARSGFNVVDMFQRIAALAFENAIRQQIVRKQTMHGTLTAQTLKKSESFASQNHFNGNIMRKECKQKNYCSC